MVLVGMTTYNSKKYLREQLDSILNQTILLDEIVAMKNLLWRYGKEYNEYRGPWKLLLDMLNILSGKKRKW